MRRTILQHLSNKIKRLKKNKYKYKMDEYTDYFMQLMIDLEEEIREEIELDKENEQREVDAYERELEENDNLKMYIL